MRSHLSGWILINFYPRPPRGGRLGSAGVGRSIELISIHALREEGDVTDMIGGGWLNLFLSTPSARRATFAAWSLGNARTYFYPRPPRGGRRPLRDLCARRTGISIHALREEGDHFGRVQRIHPRDFYPRPPRGGRPSLTASKRMQSNFYPRPPRGGRRNVKKFPCVQIEISIHALREEGDAQRTKALT